MIRYSCQDLSIASLFCDFCALTGNEKRMQFALKLAEEWKERKSGLAPFLSHRPPRAFFFLPPPHASHWLTQAFSVERGWSLVLY